MLIYLASPYTHADPTVEEDRFNTICWVAGMLINQGHHIFCPIAMAHPIKRRVGLTGKFEFWEEFDKKMIFASDELWICTMEHWQLSVGVQAEFRYASSLPRKVRYVDPHTLEIDPAL